jgi:hypothetical protein
MQKFNKENIILLILVMILINNFNFFKNYYFLISKDYSTRFNKVYNFCEKESVAFVSYLIDKYEIKQNIPIKNFKVSPDPSWIFLNSADDEIDYSKLILLNYEDESKMKFEKINLNNFKTNFLPTDIEGINKLIFKSNKNLNNVEIKLYLVHQVFGNKNIILEKDIILDSKNEFILDYRNKSLNIRNGNLLIKLEILNNNSLDKINIQNIISENITKFDLGKFDIIEKISNCYLLEKNV